MLGKNRMKNTIESLVCLVIKHTSLNEKNVARLQTAKISDSPIYFSQFAPDSLVIISKDNVLRKFVLHPKFMEMMGITKDTEMGIYLLGTPTRLAKRENMLTVCQ